METQGNSAIERLREQHSELRRERTLDLRVPGWSGLLIARYQPVRAGEMRKLSTRINKLAGQDTPEADLTAAADIIVTACPTSENAALVCQAARSGKHVLSVKPYALNLCEAQAIASASAECQRSPRRCAAQRRVCAEIAS